MAMVYSVFVSLMILWGLLSTRDLVGTINFAFSFIITFVVYIKIYCFFRGHGNESCNLIGSLPGQYFPISAHGPR